MLLSTADKSKARNDYDKICFSHCKEGLPFPKITWKFIITIYVILLADAQTNRGKFTTSLLK